MRKLWFFRGKGEFFVSILAIGIPSYYAYTIYLESKFNNSIVEHSISLLSKSTEVKQILGSPLHYKSSTNAQFVREPNYAYYAFRVGGPKGHLPVQVSAAQLPLNEVYQPPFLKHKQDQTYRLSKEVESLKQAPKSEETQLKIKELQEQAAGINNEIKEKLTTLHNRFYVLDKEKLDEVSMSRNSDELVPSDWNVWSITNLQMLLPNGTKVMVVPNQQESVFTNVQPAPWTYKKIYNKMSQMPENLSDEEAKEYNRQKTQNMYSKYNTHRLVTFLFIGFAAAGTLWYKSKYTLSTIQNSSLMYLVKAKLAQHPTLHKAGMYRLTSTVEGGRRGSIVDAKIKTEGPEKAYVHVLAKFDDGVYKAQKMELVLEKEQAKTSKRVNLM